MWGKPKRSSAFFQIAQTVQNEPQGYKKNNPKRTQSGNSAMHPDCHNIGPANTEHSFDLGWAPAWTWQRYTKNIISWWFVECFYVCVVFLWTTWTMTILVWKELERTWSSGKLRLFGYIEPVLALCWVHRLVVMLDLCRTYNIWQLRGFCGLFEHGETRNSKSKNVPKLKLNYCNCFRTHAQQKRLGTFGLGGLQLHQSLHNLPVHP